MTFEHAWAAGFYDGEGSCPNYKRKRMLSLAISHVDPRPLHRFLAAVGEGKVYGPYKRTTKRGVEVTWHQWRVDRRFAAEKVMALLWPHLSAPKREQYSKRYEAVE